MWYVHVTNEFVGTVNILETRKADLSDDGAELATRCGDAMRRRAIARGERLSGHDERCRVRTEVLEEIRQAVQHDECSLPAR